MQFRGQVGGAEGWFDWFRAYLANQIKVNPRFRDILQTTFLIDAKQHGVRLESLLAGVESIVKRLDVTAAETRNEMAQGFETVQGQVAGVQSNIAEVLALLKDRLPAVAAEAGVPLAPLVKILKEFGEKDFVAEPAKVEQLLRQKAQEFRKLLERLESAKESTSTDSVIKSLREQARVARDRIRQAGRRRTPLVASRRT